jgi:hypothetical protein
VKANWINKMMSQLRGVRRRCLRLHWKSVGGILAMQEKAVAEWLQGHGAVGAEVVDPPPPPVPEALVHADALILDAAEVLDVEAVEDAAPADPFEVVEPVVAAVPSPPPEAALSVVVEARPAFIPTDTTAPEPETMFIPPTAEDEFSLDLDAKKPAPPPEPPKVELPDDFDLDASKPTAASGFFGETIVKPAKNGRPKIKITYIRTGDPSPI